MTTDPINPRVRQIIGAVLRTYAGTLNANETLAALKATSLDRVSILQDLAVESGCHISNTEANAWVTIADIQATFDRAIAKARAA